MVVITTLDGALREIKASSRDTLMETIRDSGIGDLLAICGGACSCATCHVFIDDAAMLARLPAIGDDEEALLDSSDNRRPNSRLSCQIKVSDSLDGLRATIAPSD